ncbi:MAG: hypothetical protein IPP74_13660 [Alphaproteobacteria bacterium]|nr:hypothetical protein [Alphaproteobacteria bacterium]
MFSSAAAIEFIIDGSGTEIADGIKGDLEIPFACTLDRVTAIANESGSITVDIWKDTYANFRQLWPIQSQPRLNQQSQVEQKHKIQL